MSGRMISRRSVLALAACTALGAVGCSKTEEYTGPELILRYAENQPEDYPTTQAALAFADLVAERTEGRVKVVVYSGGELGAEQTPRLDVFNKCDRYLGDIRPHGEDIVSISARTGEGVDRLLEMIDQRLDKGTRRVTIRLPYDKGGLLDMLYREAKVEQVDYGETIDVVAVCTPRTIGQLGPLVEGWQPHREPWDN